MEFVNAGALAIPKIGFGTWRMTGDECRDGVLDAFDIGYRYIDTAQRYGNEDAVGEAVKRTTLSREEYLISTKLGLNQDRDAVAASVMESLRKLHCDYIDILLMHWPNTEIPQQETLGAAADLVERGLVRALGVSNFTAAQLREASAGVPLVMNQIEYHPYLAQPALLEAARDLGQVLAAYSPLARGRVVDEPVIIEIAAAYGKSPGQVTLRWLIQQPQVVVIPKSASSARRAENFDILDFELRQDEMDAISQLDSSMRIVDPPFAPEWDVVK